MSLSPIATAANLVLADDLVRARGEIALPGARHRLADVSDRPVNERSAQPVDEQGEDEDGGWREPERDAAGPSSAAGRARRATPSRPRPRARHPDARPAPRPPRRPVERCPITWRDAPTARTRECEGFGALLGGGARHDGGRVVRDLDNGERAERRRGQDEFVEIGGEGGAIDRIDSELVIVGHRERRQPRGFEQVAFDRRARRRGFRGTPRCRSRQTCSTRRAAPVAVEATAPCAISPRWGDAAPARRRRVPE